MKTIILRILHFLLGYEKYLQLFSLFKIYTLRLDGRKSDFLYFNKLLGAEANIIVIGACTGITTIPLAMKCRNRKIFAYEPLSSNFQVLNKVILQYKLKNIRIFNIGLGNKSEMKGMILPVKNGVKKQGMAHIADPSIPCKSQGSREIVELDYLDNRPELLNIKIDGMKVVAENFELQIFEGAKKIIEQNRPLIYCELWNDEKRKLVLELINRYNYVIYNRINNQMIPYDKNNYIGRNFFFKPISE